MNYTKTFYLTASFLKQLSFKNDSCCIQIAKRFYAAKPKALTDAQIQLQKHATEMQFKEKTSLRGTPYNFQDLTTSLQYMNSEAYRLAYGEDPVWLKYVRNHGGHKKPSYTREKCIVAGKYYSGNPCPICRDEYLVVHYQNLKLLKQFISTATGHLFPSTTTNVCRRTQTNLEVAFLKATDLGLIDHSVPFRKYNYSIYYEELKKPQKNNSLLLDILLAAKRKNVNNLLEELSEEDIVKKYV